MMFIPAGAPLFILPRTINRRRLLAAALAVAAAAHVNAGQLPRVLFVCQFGSVKSAVAREQFRALAARRALPLAAQSRGITPEAHASQALVAALRQEGIDLTTEPLRALTQADLDQADVVVLFNALPAGLNARNVRDWTDTGSLNDAYAAQRPRLMARIEALAKELARPAR
jgi:protein-tyrosine-phosphatase